MLCLRFKRINKSFLVLFLVTTLVTTVNAQSNPGSGSSNAYFGLGFGLDYGGLGIKAEFLPSKYIGVFGGAGYNLAELGYNAGLSFRPLPGKKVQPVLMAMYGYNGVIKIQYWNGSDSKTYYGPTVGAACEVQDKKNNKWSFALLVPFRSSEFHDEYDRLKEAGAEFKPGVIPIAFSVGYNWSLAKKPSKK